MRPASQSLLAGQGFYRIDQRLESAGDIFPVDIGASVIAVGPSSDISEFTVYYPDPLAPEGVRSAPLTPGSPFVGPLAARNATPIAGSLVGARPLPGRIYIAARELFDPLALFAAGESSTRVIIRPRIDLRVFPAPPPVALPTRRAARRFRFSMVVPDSAADSQFMVPIYGARHVTAVFNVFKASPDTFQVTGLLRRFSLPVVADTSVASATTLVGPVLLNEGGVELENTAGFTADAFAAVDGGASLIFNPGGLYQFCHIMVSRDAGSGNNPEDQPNAGVQVMVEAHD